MKRLLIIALLLLVIPVVFAAEPIAQTDNWRPKIVAGVPAQFSANHLIFGLNRVDVTLAELRKASQLVISAYNESPVAGDAPGEVFRYLTFDQVRLDPEIVTDVVYQFRLAHDWLGEQSTDNVHIYVWDAASWVPLPIDSVVNKTHYWQFAASFTKLAPVAITLHPPKVVPDPAVEPIPEPASDQDETEDRAENETVTPADTEVLPEEPDNSNVNVDREEIPQEPVVEVVDTTSSHSGRSLLLVGLVLLFVALVVGLIIYFIERKPPKETIRSKGRSRR